MSESIRKLYIEPTSFCNLNCKMCFRNAWVDEICSSMEPDMYSSILNTMPDTVERILFAGMGEPLLHPDIFMMVRLANQKRKYTELLSNGTLLDETICTKLMEAGLDKLWISVDTLDTEQAENYQGHRVNTAEKAAVFQRVRQKTGSATELGITWVIAKSNIHMIRKLPDFIKTYEIMDVNISHIIPLDEAGALDMLQDRMVENQIHARDPKTTPRIEIPFMDLSNSACRDILGVLLDTQAVISLGGQTLARKTGYCKFIEEGCCFVRSDGDVSPCMGLLHSTKTFLHTDERIAWHHSFGNIREQGLQSIWETGEFSAFRKKVRGFSFSPCIRCGGCDFRKENLEDCLGNLKPTCGGCLWSEGVITCP